MNQTRLKLRGAAAAACAAVVASSFMACSGDDNATTPIDSGSTASSSSVPHDSGSADVTVADSGTDSGTDSGMKDSAADAADATHDAAPAVTWAPADLCGTLYVDFGFAADAGNPAMDYFPSINQDLGNPDSFISALKVDCHFGGISQVLAEDDSGAGLSDWLNQISNFETTELGCGYLAATEMVGGIEAGADGGIPIDIHYLLPPSQLNTPITEADALALEHYFVQAVVSEVAWQWSQDYYNGGPPPEPPTLLTPDQQDALIASMNAVVALSPNVTSSTTSYTYNACVPDAGPDGATDAGTDGD